MYKITAVIIAKNAEEMIADCIDSVSFCDDVIVIDNGSTDRTRELVKHMGARVFEIKSNNFSELRNLGLSKVKTKWVLYVDSDERVDPELRKSIKEKVLHPKADQPRAESIKGDKFAAFKVKRKNFYFGDHEWPAIEEHIRVFDKKSLKKWEGKLHESPKFEGEEGALDGLLLHYTHRNLSEMVEKTAEWSGVEAELRYKSNHPKIKAWRFFRVMMTAFYDSYIKQKGYKAGTAGLVESMYQSLSIFITYARLWEMQNKKL